jgi:8-oxo-dGTP pyrophosphatase MutT (NUDIX family)
MAINTRPDIHELVICANIFIRKENNYLVLRRSEHKKYAPNVIHPVGGKVDLDENPYQAALREAKEETGLTVTNLHLRAVLLEIKPVSYEPYNWMIYHFIGDYVSGDVLETEEGELLWLTEDEIKRSQLFPSVSNIVNHIFDLSKGTIFVTNEYGGHETNILRSEKYICT